MRIDSLTLQNFRNYEELSVRFSENINVITGKNAQGKTNLLEAVYYLTGAGSFRAGSDRELARFGSDYTQMKASVNSGDRNQTIEIAFGGRRRKKILINGVRQKSSAGLAGHLTAVLFSPDDLSIIQSSPSYRRKLLDNCLCQLRPRYAACLAEYRRLYEGKTRILRDNDPKMRQVLQEFNERMCETGAVLLHYRARLAKAMGEIAADIHRSFSGDTETLGLTYQTVKTVTDPLEKTAALYEMLFRHMTEHTEAELASGRCLSGVHKDDLLITVNGQPARQFASQGQARTAAISLKMAEREILRRDTGEYPILLLDDVLSELDSGRQDFILNRIDRGQVLITCCEDRSIAEKTGGHVYTVSNGMVFTEQ